MQPRRAAAVLSLLVVALLHEASAQTFFEALRARREAQQQSQRDGATQAADGLDAGEGSAGKFALPPGARVDRDVAYGNDPAQRLDVYIPEKAARAPILLMVHGGAWMLGDKGNTNVVANKVAHWLPKGYIVASMNYRMARPPQPLDQADDVARALAFVEKQATTWGGDPDRLVLVGHSSGAHLVALLAADPGIASHQGARPWLGTIALDSAALNVVAIMESRHPRFYDRVFGDDRTRWMRSSPFHRLGGRPGPLLLVCSSRREDSCSAARAFADKAVAAGGRGEVLPLDLNHGQVNAELGRSPSYTADVQAFLQSLGLP
ncbi:MAG TPA: alpha/beta hydrolase [Caldimonas sp.]|jgi:acetyl esterase/lipase